VDCASAAAPRAAEQPVARSMRGSARNCRRWARGSQELLDTRENAVLRYERSSRVRVLARTAAASNVLSGRAAVGRRTPRSILRTWQASWPLQGGEGMLSLSISRQILQPGSRVTTTQDQSGTKV